MKNYHLSHLESLESESINIIREVASQSENPVLLYSLGKDSSVLLRLLQKSFYPAEIPIPLLHIDTGFKFPEMYKFRDQVECNNKIKLHIFKHPGLNKTIVNPKNLGSQQCCSILKTQSLLLSLKHYNFDFAMGGARRDEEKSRSKERIFSFRDKFGQWDPKNQQPELWNLYNTKITQEESIRIFPLSNWTELDIWYYIHQEAIPIVPLYFSKKRKVITSNGYFFPITEFTKTQDKVIEIDCRFRTLGCMPCSGAIKSKAKNTLEIINELKHTQYSERATRLIDHDQNSSMEIKKRDGYF